jgi:OmcA/MtrC family decaheme c-type cytochrome
MGGGRRRGWVVVGLMAAAAAGCNEPRVGAGKGPPPPATGYRLTLGGASVDGTSHVHVAFTLTQNGAPVPLADLPALRLGFTLAGLLHRGDPLDLTTLDAWHSYLLTGAQRLARLPVDGAAGALSDVLQPGAEVAGLDALTDLGAGDFSFAFATQLPSAFDPTRTVRVGAFIGAVAGTDDTSATWDGVPAGGTPEQRETVVTARCDACHGRITGHQGTRRGVRLCLTCHTVQNADPDTIDPAALTRALAQVSEARTVLAGTGATTFTATLVGAAGPITWTLSPASGAGVIAAPVTTAALGGATGTVRYTPPAADGTGTTVITATLTASATSAAPVATLTAPVALTVVQPPAGGALQVSPAAQTLVAGGPAASFTATWPGATGPATVAWTIVPATGAGTLSAATGTLTATTGATLTYTPPAAMPASPTVTLTATVDGAGSVPITLTLLPAPTGGASRLTDPNPLDLGRLVHRIHRGKNLPTLTLASSVAAAPGLPPTGAWPLPFLPGRNPPLVGARFSVVGDAGAALVPGAVASRSDNGQPARTVLEGILFPRDLRDCDACHQGAPQASAVIEAISRRTCQGCHPDVWFGAAPITDLVHFAHPGGPQADDTQCAGCHVAATATQPTVYAPIAVIHTAPIRSARYNPLTVAITSVTGLLPGSSPTVTFTVSDQTSASGGAIDSLSAPSPLSDGTHPVPRALTTVGVLLSGPNQDLGPTGDLLTGNTPLREAVPLTLTADSSHVFSYTFTGKVPAGAVGSWAVGMEARRAAAIPLQDAGWMPQWPYTGESITEYADNPVVYVDTQVGAWQPGTAQVRRRAVIDRLKCQGCHLDLNLHGGTRHNPEYCVLCHTPDTTDWNRRPKGPTGNVNLDTVYPDGRSGTVDDLEERSIHFKVLIHRIHTGAGQGSAVVELGAPLAVYGFAGGPLYFDDVRFPNRLANCLICHRADTWTIEAIPADAAPTQANESATLLHAASAAHPAGEPARRPIAAACLGCHDHAFAVAHAAENTLGGVEACASCHARGTWGVATVHAPTEPTP